MFYRGLNTPLPRKKIVANFFFREVAASRQIEKKVMKIHSQYSTSHGLPPNPYDHHLSSLFFAGILFNIIWKCRPYHFQFFKSCLPQSFLVPFLNVLIHFCIALLVVNKSFLRIIHHVIRIRIFLLCGSYSIFFYFYDMEKERSDQYVLSRCKVVEFLPIFRF